jgi:phosphatidylglycerophosphate synthase
MKKLPLYLIMLRPLLALLLLCLRHHPRFGLFAMIIVPFGLLSDIFDGIIARRLGVSTACLRRLDSAADGFFWLLLAATACLRFPDFFREHALSLGALLAAEAGTYIVSYARFGKEVATHAIASKAWTLVLFATILQLLLTGAAPVLYPVCFWLGLVTRLEVLGILLLLRQWTNDVPSLWHALQLRRGRPLRRHPLFNG